MAIIKPPLLEDLKEVLATITFSRTDKITKITDGSVNNGFFFGVARLGQKALKDVALVQSHYFPKDAYGDQLDDTAENHGIPGRFGDLGSSTYVRLSGDIGTVYTAGAHTVTGSHGIVFDLNETKTIGEIGFTYAKVVSQVKGNKTNVDPFTITSIDPEPSGHDYVINEYKAFGGRDVEEDIPFRQRIMDALNIAATGTRVKIEQILMIVNSNVLRVFNHGTNGNGKIELAVASQNGGDFTQSEFSAMLEDARRFLSLSDISLDYALNVGVTLRNIRWYPIDIGFRVQIVGGFDVDEVRKNIQLRMNKYIDYRAWELGQKVEWDDLLSIAKKTEGVQYVPDNFFIPALDITLDSARLPRIRGFEMRDLDGVIIGNTTNTINPIYYPAELDFNLINHLLRTL